MARHGKFLDLDIGGTHLVVHLALAGGCGGRTRCGHPAAAEQQSPLAARIVLDNGSGLDLTEAGTRKSLALYVVRDPHDVEGSPASGRTRWTTRSPRGVQRHPHGAGRAQAQGRAAAAEQHRGSVGNAYSDEGLHAAKMSPFKPADSLDDHELMTLYSAIRTVLQDAVARADGLAASELKREKKTNLRVHGRTASPARSAATRSAR